MEKHLQILEKKNVRITPMRQMILEYFLRYQQVTGLVELEKIFPKADRITIYRTLKTFEEKGILHRIDNGTAEVKYALCPEHCSEEQHLDLHPHFHCTQCQEISCLESIVIPPLNFPDSYKVTDITMTIKGLCPDCQT